MTNEELGKWAVERWNDEVKHRPLENSHRRTLDDTWRQVITKAASHLLPQIGPSHDELLAAERQSKDGFVPRYKEDVGLSHIIKANLADPVVLMQEVSAAGYCITPDVITDYQELDRLRMLAQATPTCHVAVGDPVTANQGCYSRHGEVLALIHGMEGGIVALVAHESDVGGGFGYYVYDAKQVQKNTGKTLRQKAERYEDLCRMEGEFDLTYENWRVLVPVTDAVREVEGLDHLMDKLKEGDHNVMNKGKPPHVGWWATAVRPELNTGKIAQQWRWWDGKVWSTPIIASEARSPSTEEVAGRCAALASIWGNNDIHWCYAWPQNARVGRVNPDTGEVTGAGPDPYKVQAAAPKPVRSSRWTKVA